MSTPGWAMPNGPGSMKQAGQAPAAKATKPAQSGVFAGVQPAQVNVPTVMPRMVAPRKIVGKSSPDPSDVHVMGMLGGGRLKKVSRPKYMQAVRRK